MNQQMNINDSCRKTTQKLACSLCLIQCIFSNGQILSPSKQLLKLKVLPEDSFKGAEIVGLRVGEFGERKLYKFFFPMPRN